MNRWEIKAECNMDANNYQTVIVKANTERKAIMLGKKKLLETNFYVTNITARKEKEDV